MPLNKEQLKKDLRQALSSPSTTDNTEDIVDKIATAIDTFVKSGTVTIPQGIPVTTAGTAVSQAGATTAPATGTIS